MKERPLLRSWINYSAWSVPTVALLGFMLFSSPRSGFFSGVASAMAWMGFAVVLIAYILGLIVVVSAARQKGDVATRGTIHGVWKMLSRWAALMIVLFGIPLLTLTKADTVLGAARWRIFSGLLIGILGVSILVSVGFIVRQKIWGTKQGSDSE